MYGRQRYARGRRIRAEPRGDRVRGAVPPSRAPCQFASSVGAWRTCVALSSESRVTGRGSTCVFSVLFCELSGVCAVPCFVLLVVFQTMTAFV